MREHGASTSFGEGKAAENERVQWTVGAQRPPPGWGNKNAAGDSEGDAGGVVERGRRRVSDHITSKRNARCPKRGGRFAFVERPDRSVNILQRGSSTPARTPHGVDHHDFVFFVHSVVD